MNIIILALNFFYFLISPALTFAFDSKRLQEDLDYIDHNFLKDNKIKSSENSAAKAAVKSKSLPDQEILDLESEYFDEVKTKKAAIRKRSR